MARKQSSITEKGKPGRILGPFQYDMIMAIRDNPSRAYGLGIRDALAEMTGGPVSDSAVYTTLERMEAKGFLSSSWVAGGAERGQRRKRIYKVEGLGEQAAEEYERRYLKPRLRLAEGLP